MSDMFDLGSTRRSALLGTLIASLLFAAEPLRTSSEDFQNLFNGTDLTGWVVEGTKDYKDADETRPVWTVKDGMIDCAGKGFGFLRYDKEFADFVFSVEYRMSKGCNSGIGIRGVKFTGPAQTRPSFAAYEIQLLDDAGKPPTEHSSGSLYRYVAPTANAVKAAGEWNTIEVACVGPHIRVTINGQTVQDVDQSKIAAIEKKPLRGYVSLQNHGGHIEFRNARLKELPPPVKEYTYKKTKHGELKMFVHFPADWKEGDRRPGIVFFFGGGWTNGSPKQFEDQAAYLATRGMVAARADYRVKSRHDVSPDKCVEDAKSAIRWLRQNAAMLGIDPDRIVASGGSAGGHIAACTALTDGLEAEGEDTSVSSRPNALVLFNPALRFSGIPQMLSRLDGNEELGKLISPTLHVTKSTPPTILFFGTADQLLRQGEEFMARSKEVGHRAELFTADGMGHGFFNRSPWKERTLYRADEFLATLGYVEGKPTIELP